MGSRRRNQVPKSSGKYFDFEDELLALIAEASASLQVSKTQIINDAIRLGLRGAIDKAKYG